MRGLEVVKCVLRALGVQRVLGRLSVVRVSRGCPGRSARRAAQEARSGRYPASALLGARLEVEDAARLEAELRAVRAVLLAGLGLLAAVSSTVYCNISAIFTLYIAM